MQAPAWAKQVNQTTTRAKKPEKEATRTLKKERRNPQETAPTVPEDAEIQQDSINPYDLNKQIAVVLKAIDKRTSSKDLDTDEMQKHLEAIQQSVNKTSGPTRSSPRKKKKLETAAPISPQRTAPSETDSAGPSREPANRKRGNNKPGTNSDSSEPRKRLTKRAKKLCIPETSREEVEIISAPNESPRTRLRRIQMEIRSDKGASHETKVRLNNRSNLLYEQITLKGGRKITRRDPKKHFKPKPKKPENGASITNHPPGKMLKAIRIMDRQYAGKLIRYYFSGFGYQLRLAEAERKMQELTLPELRPTRTIKAKNGRTARLEVDPRRSQAHLDMRRTKRAMDAIDQHLCAELQPYPVTDQSDITLVDLMASDEEANIAAHPRGWRGREIPNDPEDSAKRLVSLLNFMMPPYQLGNLLGDEERFDKKGNLKIIKEEVVSDVEQVINEEKSEPNEVETIAVNETEEKGDKAPEPVKIEDDEPVQSTSTGITHYNPDPANLRNIPGHLEIDGDTMAHYFAEHMSKDLTLKTRAGKICATWIPDRPGAQEPENMDRDQEPDITDPAPKYKENGEEDIMQILDDHIAVSPNPAQAETEIVSVLEEADTYAADEADTENSDDNQIIDVVTNSASDQEGTIIVDPSTMEEGVQTLARGVEDPTVEGWVANLASDQEGTKIADPSTMEEGVQTLARGVEDPAVEDVHEVSNENNNNQAADKVMLEMQANFLQMPRQPSRQLLLHQVPIRFPVPSNLMESMDSLMYIHDALSSLIGNLPSDVLIDAHPLHQVSSQQARAAVVLTFNTELVRNQIMRAYRDNTATKSKAYYYFTELPKRLRVRRQTHSEDELQDMRKEAKDSQKEMPKEETKNSSKAVHLATKVKNKYTLLNTRANKRKENKGAVFTGTKQKRNRPREGTANAASTPITTTTSDTTAEDLSNLVQEISAIVPCSKIDAPQTPETTEPHLQVEIENDLYTNPQSDDVDVSERRRLEEECLREETILVERVEHDRRVERMRRRANSDGELRETMRPRAGPADLRNSSLNREKDARELMRPRPGPSDLRYSNLQPNKDLRQIMNPKPVRSMETERSDLENAIIAKTRDLESSLKAKDRTIRRLLAQMNGGELSSEDSSAEESEAEPSEDEIPSVDEVELTNVNNADDETGVGTPVPGPSVSTQIPGPSVSIPGTQETSVGTPVPDPSVGTQIPGPSVSSPGREKQSKMKPSPIKYPGCNERSHSGDDVPLKKLTTPKRSRPIIKTDLRKKLKKVPVFSKTKLHNDKGPVQSRMNRDLPGPWKTGSTSDCGTEHRNRPFIANSDCARYEVGSARSWPNNQQTDNVEEKEEEERLSEDDISTDECKKGDTSEEEGA